MTLPDDDEEEDEDDEEEEVDDEEKKDADDVYDGGAAGDGLEARETRPKRHRHGAMSAARVDADTDACSDLNGSERDEVASILDEDDNDEGGRATRPRLSRSLTPSPLADPMLSEAAAASEPSRAAAQQAAAAAAAQQAAAAAVRRAVGVTSAQPTLPPTSRRPALWERSAAPTGRDASFSSMLSHTDPARGKRYQYERYVGRTFTDLRIAGPTGTGASRAKPPPPAAALPFAHCVINGIVKVDGQKDFYFVYYDLTENKRGPPLRSDPTAWKVALCKDVVATPNVYRFT